MDGMELRNEAENFKKELGLIMCDTTALTSTVVLLKILDKLNEISVKLDKKEELVIEVENKINENIIKEEKAPKKKV